MDNQVKAKRNLKDYVDGKVDTPYEIFMLFVICINTVSLGLETSRNITADFRNILFMIDQICLWIFVIELIFKIIAYNKKFFGEMRLDDDHLDENGKPKNYFHWNKWNVSDLLIVLVSFIASLPYFTVFRVFRVFRSFKVIKAVRSFRAVKSFKIVNEFEDLRSTFKGLVRAIPGILWTFAFLAVFAYVYAIIGTNMFRDECPDYFGTLGTALLTLCQITTFDSWFSGVARPIIKIYPLAWIYFVSYVFIAASIIMNVIVGIIVDSMGKERERDREQEKLKRANSKDEITLEKLSEQIAELQKQIERLSCEK
ncbi:MAG: ion transporter [Spirochaetaceae bacterium]|nr:ion transporter [Spirochaetaceae bacterium]